ncbi:gliding motility lipoprotein GldH [Zhouia spongiae]|uniref:Gliding motility lipoprotein GldH n=1 Tax=Zhouia spongiae TaxID=2202721 RepID=A0ABY3YPT9_9FLAO|nr:gliding motility lipoprotein GldH [Zhouia spongiae]UNY99658.1 gliding motility lipoprotein GldH [Zhouia spongiae]
MARISLFFLIFICFVACDPAGVYSEYRSVEGGWDKEDIKVFTFKAPDTIRPYHIFLNLRNNENYKYSNLFLIVNLDFPNNESITDTLEYEMARPDGEWLGKGFSSLKESKLWYKENVIFPDSGTYRISVEQAMRKMGSVEGIESLKGITDVGIKIEKANNK